MSTQSAEYLVTDTWLARFMRGWPSRFVLWLFHTRVIGIENVPPGGAILAGNHVSYLDPILLWCAAPRRTHFMAKQEFWDAGIVGKFLDRLWSFPVKRGEGDRAAITRATALLQAGELVGIFPEGTRAEGPGQELGSAHGGVAFIALRASAPVVPVAFVGTDKAWPRGQRLPKRAPVTIAIGEPIDTSAVAPEAGRKERVAVLTTHIMDAISEVLREAHRSRETGGDRP